MSMLHPIFTVLVKRPDLVVEHLAGYAQLAKQETETAGTHLAVRGLAWAVVLVAGSVCLTLAGVAVMLGVMLDRFSWVLVLVPGVMGLLAIGAAATAKKPLPPHAFAQMKAQIEADVQALRTAGDDA